MIDLTTETLGVPHSSLRPQQAQAILKSIEHHRDGGGNIFIEAPTGIGKSTIACAMASEDNTTVLVSTLGLLEQYERIYGFSIIKGRQEYPCVHKSKVKEWKSKYGILPKASDCHYKRSYDCEYSDTCPYLIAKDKAIGANKTACTYKYASMSDGIKKRTGIIAFDECHNSAEEMLSFMEFSINSETMNKYNLPDFPLDHYGSGGEGDVVNSNVSIIINTWMILCVKILNDFDIFESLTPRGVAKMRLSEQFVKVMSRMEREKEWFMYWGTEKESQNSLFSFKSSGKRMIFSLKPLSAKTAADDILQNKKTRIFMSATIGKPDGLASELGLDSFFSYEYDHPVPAEYRPVFDLGMDKMTRDNLSCNPQLYRVQAVKIKNFINSLDRTWRGIILTTSYYKIKQLKEILNSMIGDRIFQYSQDAKTVTGRINEFISDKRSGMIAIDTIAGWGTGLDLKYDIARFAIIAGVPFPNPSDRYEQARMQRDGGRKYALWKTYNAIPQISGRVSRGEKDTSGNWLTNVSAIADGNALMPQAKMHYPNWYKESIVK